ncbi:hypothetical protein AV530_005481 [Patagioenas fasciata monilis]|uniref:Uncharacterized protein n=1 Tax=Patagioenas fasciata monilis TaxID=372326 RepID=A0A1V4JLK9_PATFA|nr:hypothetical protein AV530_005481 [Patagioenas fasciata monilis]
MQVITMNEIRPAEPAAAPWSQEGIQLPQKSSSRDDNCLVLRLWRWPKTTIPKGCTLPELRCHTENFGH